MEQNTLDEIFGSSLSSSLLRGCKGSKCLVSLISTPSRSNFPLVYISYDRIPVVMFRGEDAFLVPTRYLF